MSVPAIAVSTPAVFSFLQQFLQGNDNEEYYLR